MKLLKEIFKNNKTSDEIFLTTYELCVRRKKRFYLRMAFVLAILIILFLIYFICVYKNLNELIGYLK